jgi:YVTN family beta-propeller protein
MEEVLSNQYRIWSPFVGPRPFKRDPEEQKIFFGRNYETEKIISLIYSHKLVLVYAQSGAGKTSIFNAKIVPLLEQKGLHVLPVARVGLVSQVLNGSLSSYTAQVSSVDTANPYLLSAYQSLVPDTDIDDNTLLRIESFSNFLNVFYPDRVNQRGKPIPKVCVFDQCEEIFHIYSDPNRWHEQREDFFKQISDALESSPILRIIFIIREDYLAQLDPFARLLPENLKPRFRLERLQKDPALHAVKGPLEKAEAYTDKKLIKKLFEEGVIEKLIEDLLKIRVETFGGQSQELKGEFVEPIQLQVVCQRLWNKLKISKIDQIDQSFLGDIDKALVDFYVDAIREASKLPDINERKIREWFEEKLITSSGTRGVVHRGASSTGGLPNMVADVLEQKYIIRKEERSGAQWYELTHDRLIRPIKDSNRDWRELERRKSLRRKLIITIPSVVAIAFVLGFWGYSNLNNYEPPPPVLGISPTYVSVNEDTNMIYAANSVSDSISVVKGMTNEVVHNIEVGMSLGPMAVNPRTDTIYIISYHGQNYSVSIFDGKSNELINRIEIDFTPSSIAVIEKINKILVGGVTSVGNGTISVIDGNINKIVDEIAVGEAPSSIAVDSDSNKVYSGGLNFSLHSFIISVFDGTTNKRISEIPIMGGTSSDQIAVDSRSNMIYATATAADSTTVNVINGTTNKIVDEIQVQASPTDIAVNPGENTVYLLAKKSMLAMDADTEKTFVEIITAENMIDMIINAETNMIYISKFDLNSLYVINGEDNQLESLVRGPKSNEIKLGEDIIEDQEHSRLSFNPSTNIIYFQGLKSTFVVDGKTNEVVDEIAVGDEPSSIAVNYATNKIYVADSARDPKTEKFNISIIDGNLNEVVDSFVVDEPPSSMAVNEAKNKIIVSGTDYSRGVPNSAVSIVDGSLINGTNMTTNKIEEHIVLPDIPYDIAVNPGEHKIFVLCKGSIFTIDGDTNEVDHVPLTGATITDDIALDLSRNMIYVTAAVSNTVNVINGTTNKIVDEIQVQASPTDIAVNPGENKIFVTTETYSSFFEPASVKIIDGKINKVVGNIKVSGTADDIIFNPPTNITYVSNPIPDTISVKNGSTIS